MKLKIVMPVIESEISKVKTDEIQYFQSVVNKDTEIDIEFIDYGYEFIENCAEETFNAPGILMKIKKAEEDGFDGVLSNCCSDPGVFAAREMVKIPVFGAFEPTMMAACTLGEKVTIISMDRVASKALNQQIRQLGITNRINEPRYVDQIYSDILKEDNLIEALTKESIEAIEKDDADVIVLGCTAMYYIIDRLRANIKQAGYNIPILEPASVALKLLETNVSLGMSNTMYYKSGSESKKIVWWADINI